MIITLATNAVAQGLMVVHAGGFSPQDSASPAMRFIATGETVFGLPNALIIWALVGAASAEREDFIYGGMSDRPDQIARMDALLDKAIRIDQTNARAYVVRGMIERPRKISPGGRPGAAAGVKARPS